MTDMVERVAAAIQAAFPTIGFKKDALYQAARAAIEAMREPTEAMYDAGCKSAGDCMMWSPEPGEGLDDFDPEPAWSAMIDAALSQSEDRS